MKRISSYTHLKFGPTHEGPSLDFDIDLETDGNETYQAFLYIIRSNENCNISRIPLMMGIPRLSRDRALQNLNDTLKNMVVNGVKKDVKPVDFDFEKALKLEEDIEAGRVQENYRLCF